VASLHNQFLRDAARFGECRCRFAINLGRQNRVELRFQSGIATSWQRANAESNTLNADIANALQNYRAVTKKKYALIAMPTPITKARTFRGSAFCA
jgi:hypothetical protein